MIDSLVKLRNIGRHGFLFVIAVLTTPSEDITELNKAIISCQNLVNREWGLRHSTISDDTIQINVGKVTVPVDNLFDQGIYTSNTINLESMKDVIYVSI